MRTARCLQERYRQDNRRVTASHVSFHRLKKRQAESLTCRITPIGVIPYRRHPRQRMSVKMTHECRIPVADRHHLRTEGLAMSGSPPNRPGPAALRLRPPRVVLGTGFWASNLARAWFSASRRLSTSRRAAELMV